MRSKEAFEQHVVDLKEASVIARAHPAPQPPSPLCLGVTPATKLRAAPRVVNNSN